MPRVTRSREIAADPDRVWDLVSDPHNMPRWWPKVTRVEDVEDPGGKRARWTAVLATERGRGVRADFRCTAATSAERYEWEQEIAGTPFDRILKSSKVELKMKPTANGHRGDARRRRAPARALAARRDDDEGRRPAAPRRCARRDRERARGSEWLIGRRRRSGGGGAIPAKRVELSDAALSMLRAELGEAEPAPRAELGEVELPAAGKLPKALAEAAGAAEVLTDDEARVRHAAGRSYPDLVRLRSGALEEAPDAVVMPADAARARRDPRRLLGGRRRRRAVRRRHQRRRRSRPGARRAQARDQPRSRTDARRSGSTSGR